MDKDQNSWRHFERIKRPKNFSRRLKKIEASSLRHAHKYVIARWSSVREVQRQTTVWMLFVGLLIFAGLWQGMFIAGAYTKQAAESGSAYSEGVIGPIETMNPLFASSQTERSASKLLFSGLLRYDSNNNLSGDLASAYRYEENGKKIIVTLRNDIFWHDGAPVTSRDVLYTVATIQDPATRTFLESAWRNVQVTADGDKSVIFTLPTVYAPFVDLLTVGILPEHILSALPAANLRSAPFNRAPVGTGPFVFRDIKNVDMPKGHVILNTDANTKYHLGTPKLSKFYLHGFANEDDLKRSLTTDEINAAAGLSVSAINGLPESKKENINDSPLYNGTYAFFNLTNASLKDVSVRKALRLAVDQSKVISQLDSRVKTLSGPLLLNQLGLSADQQQSYRQPQFNLEEAEKALDAAGWVRGQDTVRTKDGQRLDISIVAVQSGDFPKVVETIASDWKKIGVNVRTELVRQDDLQQNVISPRAYDVLVYELALGRDPDVYAYWHSSQRGQSNFNLSEYSSPIVDDALSSARSRIEPDLRQAKYRAFYQQWLSDAPAVALYQPTLHYVTNRNVTAIQGRSIVDTTDRYARVRYWSSNMIETYTTP